MKMHVRIVRAGSLALLFLWEVILANLRVTYDVLTPRHRMRPGVVAVPLEPQSDIGITLLANLMALTPGTLSLDVSSDRRVLFIHAMYIESVESVTRRVKDSFERRIVEVIG